MNDHLARAKQYIAIAESGDSKLAAYKKAADEIVKARERDFHLTWTTINEHLGRERNYAERLVKWRTNSAGPRLPFAEPDREPREVRATKAILKDPDRAEEVMADLPTKALQDIADRADEVVAERRQARGSEQSSGVTGRHVSDFKPDEYWMDNIIIRLNRNAREAASLFERGGGLLGAMEVEKAYEYLEEAERLISEVRVAFQERVRDEVQV